MALKLTVVQAAGLHAYFRYQPPAAHEAFGGEYSEETAHVAFELRAA